jgi:hypothetical protein
VGNTEKSKAFFGKEQQRSVTLPTLGGSKKRSLLRRGESERKCKGSKKFAKQVFFERSEAA